jgi:hypothetical protein
MPVIEYQLDRIITLRLDGGNVHILLAKLQDFLTRSVAGYFRGWRIDTEILARQLEIAAIIELEF